MTRTVVVAEYLADEQKLKLEEPLEGIEDHQHVNIVIESAAAQVTERPWMRFRGVLPEGAGREIAFAIREAFGRDEIEV